MLNNEVDEKLSHLSLEQLNNLLEKVKQKTAEKKQAIKAASKAPPRTQNDIQKLAELQGLDLSGLMREISKRHP
ncbi:hypothetical protein [uncultured Amphritea sp.]|uniref:hypothetical protein n=1 Tax=Amphritea sp. TaxID=1872502 RepID=UPI001D2EA29F|nr:hypothetical protein [uncultured Amphritea sp.]MBR9867799.1 hypothetical protein [Oceanospirillales bacterium]MBR9888751.1 hypothetical protein [Oceanospirillales bacterium]